MGFYSASANLVNTASLAPNGTNGTPSMSSQNKQERMELLTYVKAHFDLIAVTLLITYLGYSIYRLNKGGK
jgi:hypothetical protein